MPERSKPVSRSATGAAIGRRRRAARRATLGAALGAGVAVALTGGGIGSVSATVSTGDRPVLVPIEPCRLADTRPAPDTIGDRAARLPENETVAFAAHGRHGNCNLPATATALALNVTALGATRPTFLTLHAAGVATPPGSHLNPVPGASPAPNAVTVDLSPTGEFAVFNRFGTVDVLIDVVGYYEHHDHDDRYPTRDETYTRADVYTRAETDALLGALTPGAIADFEGGNHNDVLSRTDTVYRTVFIDPPADGIVIVNSTGAVSSTNASAFAARCSITQGTVLDGAAIQLVADPDGSVSGDQIAGTRGFVVTAGTPFTANLVCDTPASTDNVQLSDTHLTAVYVPMPDIAQPR